MSMTDIENQTSGLTRTPLIPDLVSSPTLSADTPFRPVDMTRTANPYNDGFRRVDDNDMAQMLALMERTAEATEATADNPFEAEEAGL